MAVYFLHCPQANRIKIGYAQNVAMRAYQLATASPGPLVILAVIESGTRKTELEMRERFRAHHRYREWFEPAPEILTFCEAHRYVAPPSVGARPSLKRGPRDGQVDIIKKRLGLPLDTELANLAGVIFQAVSNWRSKGVVPASRCWKITDAAIARGLLRVEERESFVSEMWAAPPIAAPEPARAA